MKCQGLNSLQTKYDIYFKMSSAADAFDALRLKEELGAIENHNCDIFHFGLFRQLPM